MNYSKLSSSELMAALPDESAQAEILSRHRETVLMQVIGHVGQKETAVIIADIAFERAFSRAAHFDSKEWALGQWITDNVYSILKNWESPARKEFFRILGEAGGDRLPYYEVQPAIMSALRNLILENDTMITIAERLINEGHDVWEAAKFASIKAEHLDVRWEPDGRHPVNELFAAINRESDPAKLTELWGFVFDACYDDSEFDLVA